MNSIRDSQRVRLLTRVGATTVSALKPECV